MGLSASTSLAFERALAHWEPLWQRAYDEGVSRRGLQAVPSLKECLAETVRRHEDDPCVVTPDGIQTFSQMNDQACRIANALAARGLVKGDAVVVALEDSAALVALLMACYKGGFVAVGTDARSTACELAERLAECKARAIAIDEAHASAARRAVAEAATDALAVVVEATPSAVMQEVLAGEGDGAFELLAGEALFGQLAAYPDASEPAVSASPTTRR